MLIYHHLNNYMSAWSMMTIDHLVHAWCPVNKALDQISGF